MVRLRSKAAVMKNLRKDGQEGLSSVPDGGHWSVSEGTESEVSHKSPKDRDNTAPAQDRHCRPFKSHVNTLELGQGSPTGPKRTPDSSLSPWVSMRKFLWIPSLVPLSVTHTRIKKMSTSPPLDSEITWNMKMFPSSYDTADTQGAQCGNKARGFKQRI